MKVDLLVIAVHPDDAELCCGGTILSHIEKGHQVAMVDLTQGELGTRGNAEIRLQEAQDAAEVLGVQARENLGFRDGFFKNDEAHQMELIKKIRQYQPEMVITNAPTDRHPDHGRAGHLVKEACFYAGLPKIETSLNNEKQEAWRPHIVYHFIQFYHLTPDLVLDIEPYVEQKIQAIKAYRSQFYDPESEEPETILTNPKFFDFLKGRWQEMGAAAHLNYGEGFISDRTISVESLFDLSYKGKA